MRKSKIMLLLAAGIVLQTTLVMEAASNKAYANQSIQETKSRVEVVGEDGFSKFLEEAKKEAKEKNNEAVFVHLLGKENLHKSGAIDLNTISDPKDLFKDDNGKIEANEKYVFVKIDGKHIAGNNRVVIMNARDVVVSTRKEYEQKFNERKNKLYDFSYENSQIHSLEQIEDDKNFLTLLDAHGVWMGKEIKVSNLFDDVKVYSKVLKIENKLTVNYGVNIGQQDDPDHNKEGYNKNLSFENFKQNDEDIKKMITNAGIKDSDEDREKIKKFAIQMGEVEYDSRGLEKNASSEYNLASDLFAVTMRKRARCVGFSTTAARAFNLMGIPAYVAGAKVQTGQLHAVTRAYYDGAWHTVDLTSDKRPGETAPGFSELLFNRSEDTYGVVVRDFSPKEALANIETLSNAQVMTNTTFENWAKNQKAEDLVLINREAVYDNAKDKSAVERDPKDKIQERLESRKIEKQKAEEQFKQREEQNRIKWEEAEKERAEQRKEQEKERRRLQEQFLRTQKSQETQSSEQETPEKQLDQPSDLPKIERETQVPEMPEVPGDSNIPDMSKELEVPEVPETSESSSIPDMSVVPEVPNTSDIPATPEAPETSETLDIQNISEVPEMPDALEVPNTPETSEASATLNIYETLETDNAPEVEKLSETEKKPEMLQNETTTPEQAEPSKDLPLKVKTKKVLPNTGDTPSIPAWLGSGLLGFLGMVYTKERKK